LLAEIIEKALRFVVIVSLLCTCFAEQMPEMVILGGILAEGLQAPAQPRTLVSANGTNLHPTIQAVGDHPGPRFCEATHITHAHEGRFGYPLRVYRFPVPKRISCAAHAGRT